MSTSRKLTTTEIKEELKSAEVYPTGPVSAWPKERHDDLLVRMNGKTSKPVKATFNDMAKGLMKTTGQAIRYGKVSGEIREERYATCKECPYFLEESKRCSECGCFMEAKTWIGGNPDELCPKKKWSR